MELLLHITELGLIYVCVVLGVFFTSRLIKLDDLTLEGSFNLGGALGAFLLSQGHDPILATVMVLIAGLLSGSITAWLHTRLGIHHLISGLAMTAALYSLSLKLAGAHLVLTSGSTLFDLAPQPFVLLGITAIVLYLIRQLLCSEVGLLLHAVGSNRQMLTLLGKSAGDYQMLGLSLANALAALSGMLFVQWLGFYSITNYIGTWITGLSGLMLSEMIPLSLSLAVPFGCVLNQLLFAAVIELQIDPLWNQALKAALVIILLRVGRQKKNGVRKSYVAA